MATISNFSSRSNGTAISSVNAELFYRFGGEDYIIQAERKHGTDERVTASCSSLKDAYPTYAAARRAFRLKNANGQREKRIYKCGECGCWHFTTNVRVIKDRSYDRSLYKRTTSLYVNNISVKDLRDRMARTRRRAVSETFINAL